MMLYDFMYMRSLPSSQLNTFVTFVVIFLPAPVNSGSEPAPNLAKVNLLFIILYNN